MSKDEQIAALLTALENPTEAMLDAGEQAIDDYYNGTKDAPFRGSIAACMKAVLQAALAAAPAAMPWCGRNDMTKDEQIAALRTALQRRIDQCCPPDDIGTKWAGHCQQCFDDLQLIEWGPDGSPAAAPAQPQGEILGDDIPLTDEQLAELREFGID